MYMAPPHSPLPPIISPIFSIFKIAQNNIFSLLFYFLSLDISLFPHPISGWPPPRAYSSSPPPPPPIPHHPPFLSPPKIKTLILSRIFSLFCIFSFYKPSPHLSPSSYSPWTAPWMPTCTHVHACMWYRVLSRLGEYSSLVAYVHMHTCTCIFVHMHAYDMF